MAAPDGGSIEGAVSLVGPGTQLLVPEVALWAHKDSPTGLALTRVGAKDGRAWWVAPGVQLSTLLSAMGLQPWPDDALWAAWAGVMGCAARALDDGAGELVSSHTMWVDARGVVTAAYLPGAIRGETMAGRAERLGAGARRVAGFFIEQLGPGHWSVREGPFVDALFGCVRALDDDGHRGIAPILRRATAPGQVPGPPPQQALGALVVQHCAEAVAAQQAALRLALGR
jgi:hypothetical protein